MPRTSDRCRVARSPSPERPRPHRGGGLDGVVPCHPALARAHDGVRGPVILRRLGHSATPDRSIACLPALSAHLIPEETDAVSPLMSVSQPGRSRGPRFPLPPSPLNTGGDPPGSQTPASSAQRAMWINAGSRGDPATGSATSTPPQPPAPRYPPTHTHTASAARWPRSRSCPAAWTLCRSPDCLPSRPA